MYVWQMNDGTWRISLMVGSAIVIPFGTIDRKVLDGVYASEQVARDAMAWLRGETPRA